MSIILLLVILGTHAFVSFVVCSLFASRDARLAKRRLGKRVVLSGLCSALTFAMVVGALFLYVAAQQAAPGVNLNLSIFALMIASGVVFVVAAVSGTVGYMASYRMFENRGRPLGDSIIDVGTRMDETGNPYQPPTI